LQTYYKFQTVQQ